MKPRSWVSPTAALVAVLGIVFGVERAMAQRPLGIDVSHWDGSNNWATVKGAGITFAWAKATQGTDFTDGEFVHNVTHARAVGVYIGAYHYAEFTNSAAAEASHFWSVAGNYITGGGVYLMPMLDCEVLDLPGTYTKTVVSQWVNTWCQITVSNAAAAGVTVKPLIYTFRNWIDNHLNSTVTQWTPWIAASHSYTDPQTASPNPAPWPTWTVCQYAGGKVPGVPLDSCDRDVFNGTLDELRTTLVIGDAPIVITSQPQDRTVIEGNTATFSVVAGPLPLNYQWRKNGNSLSNGANVSGATNATLTLSNVTINDDATYDVLISNSLNSTNSNPAVLTVLKPPCLLTNPVSVTITQGQATTLCAAAGCGVLPLYYQWQWVGHRTYSAGTNNTCFTAQNVGGYCCILTNGAGSVTSAVAYVTAVVGPSSQVVTQGGSATFAVTVTTTDPSVACQWQKDGVNLSDGSNVSGSRTAVLSLSPVTTNDAGDYTAVVSNGDGSSLGATAALSVATPCALLSARWQADGALVLGISGTLCSNCVVQYTTDWTGWTNLGPPVSTNGVYQCVDLNAANNSQRFYRLRLCP